MVGFNLSAVKEGTSPVRFARSITNMRLKKLMVLLTRTKELRVLLKFMKSIDFPDSMELCKLQSV